MRLSNSYFYTLRENVKDEETISGNLLTRSGMIKKISNGIYMYMPLGYKVIKNIENIIKEEMENVNAGQMLMPSLIPDDVYHENSKLEEAFSLNDRFGKEYFLAPTNDELFKVAATSMIKSYKDLPFSIYHIHDKFRDEQKARYGLVRIKEFLMKEAYSFDMDEKGLNDSYNEMYNAYKKIFTRLGIDYKIVKSAPLEKDCILSEEFQAVTDIGEDTLVLCDSCGYAANLDIAKCDINEENNLEEIKIRELIKTPDVATIDEVSNYLEVDKKDIVKTLIYNADGEFFAALVKGDKEVNEAKLKKLLNKTCIALADAADVEKITGAEIGFIGPIGLDIPVIIDNEVMQMKNFVVGANKTDYHYKNANLEDFNYLLTGDIRNITMEDKCPKCGSEINFKNGIEIGNTFKLGTNYSSKYDLTYLNKDNENALVHTGCYLIGLDRCLASIVEQHHDENGIIWPFSIAPFKVAIVVVNTQDDTQMDAANYLYNELKNNGISTILDDRNERVGVKFNDMDLIGIPIRITIGNKIQEQLVEIKERHEEEYFEISLYDALVKVEDIIDEK